MTAKERSPRLRFDGALVIDKPRDLTSADVLRKLKKKFHIEKLGHAGTLDPLATGILIVLLGEATKAQALVMDGGKAYSGAIQLGLSTESDDITGGVKHEDRSRLPYKDSATLSAAAKKFSGKIVQRPPAVSAIKVAGERSYDLARKGEDVVHPEREVFISSLSLKLLDGETIDYSVECSKGTYVRSLARDIGEFIGIPSCLKSIRRTRSGSFTEADAVPLEQVLEADTLEDFIRPMSALFSELGKVKFGDAERARLYSGDQRPLEQIGSELGNSALAALYDRNERVFGLIERPAAGANEKSAASWRIRCLFSALPAVEENRDLV